MNEQQFALQVRRALDASTEQLPYRVTHRLRVAREAALARMGRPRAESVIAPPAIIAAGAAAVAVRSAPASNARRIWWRAALASLPVVFVTLGLVAISVWQEFDAADETAEVDLALLTDDLPISAYADRGFGVYLRNSQR